MLPGKALMSSFFHDMQRRKALLACLKGLNFPQWGGLKDFLT